MPSLLGSEELKLHSTSLLALTLLVILIPNGRGYAVQPKVPLRDWVSLSEWAEQNDFKLIWLKKDESLTLTKQSVRLSFRIDSLCAEINGVNVWLRYPITLRDGRVCVASLDLLATIRPILFPASNRPGNSIKTICLDPGHGGKDTGGTAGTFLEKRYTLLLARELEKQLRAAGFEVLLTRTIDKFVELEDRPAFANRRRADLFISLHFNISPQGEASGVEVYCLPPPQPSSTNARGESAESTPFPGNRQDAQNVLLAYQLQKSLVNNLRAEDRGLRRARFAVLRAAMMPAVLIEGGFLSDSDERAKITDLKYRGQMATAILQGVLAYKRTVESRICQTQLVNYCLPRRRQRSGARSMASPPVQGVPFCYSAGRT